MNIQILYEDNHLLVVVKPPNLLSQGDITGDPDLLTLMKGYLKEKYEKPGNVYLGLVHRLDRPAGGVMVFAKTSKSAGRLSDQIRTHHVRKHYYAVIHGQPESMSGSLLHYLIKDTTTNTVKTTTMDNKEAKEARLNYQVIAQYEQFSLVRVDLLTG